jgi:hypothetical protein
MNLFFKSGINHLIVPLLTQWKDTNAILSFES